MLRSKQRDKRCKSDGLATFERSGALQTQGHLAKAKITADHMAQNVPALRATTAYRTVQSPQGIPSVYIYITVHSRKLS